MRRQRTLNRRYASEEFTSIFTENRDLAPHLGISDLASQEHVVEQMVEIDMTVEMDASGLVVQEVEVQEECVVETEPESIPLPEVSPQDVEISLPQAVGVIETASDVDHLERKISAGSSGRQSARDSRASSPYSDISEESSTTRSTDSDRYPTRGRRKRSSGDSSLSDHAPVKRSQRIASQQEESVVRTKGTGLVEFIDSIYATVTWSALINLYVICKCLH